VALDRESRGDAQGYVTPAQARAFLQLSRHIDLREAAMPPRDAVTRAYFRDVDAQPSRDEKTPGASPPEEVDTAASSTADAVIAMVELLQDAGVIPGGARPLLEAPQPTSVPRLASIRAQFDYVQDRDPDAFAMRNAELAYLANVMTAGATIQSRSLRPDEASEAVMAVCNLGLESWPLRWRSGEPLSDDFLVHHDLVRVFQVGWTVLHEDVCMYAADQLVGALATVHSTDDDLRDSIEALRRTLMRHARAGSPWEARDALDVIAILDTPAWAALLSLIDQLPTMHAALGATLAGATRQIEASAFEFISEPAHVQQVREFMRLLPDRFR
jgi:hypothetical protein